MFPGLHFYSGMMGSTHQETIAIVNEVCYLGFPRGGSRLQHAGPPCVGGKMSEGKAWARVLIVVFVGGNAQGNTDKLSKLKFG